MSRALSSDRQAGSGQSRSAAHLGWPSAVAWRQDGSRTKAAGSSDEGTACGTTGGDTEAGGAATAVECDTSPSATACTAAARARSGAAAAAAETAAVGVTCAGSTGGTIQ